MELILKEEIKPFLFENGRIKHFEVFITPPPPPFLRQKLLSNFISGLSSSSERVVLGFFGKLWSVMSVSCILHAY